MVSSGAMDHSAMDHSAMDQKENTLMLQVPIHAIALEHGDIGEFGNDMIVKRLEFRIDTKCGSIVCSAEAGEDHLTMPHNVKV